MATVPIASSKLKLGIKPQQKPVTQPMPFKPYQDGPVRVGDNGPSGSRYPDLPTTSPAGVAPAPVSAGGPAQRLGGRLTDAQMRIVEDRIGAAPARRIGGGKNAKPGATYRSGEFKGLTLSQAFTKAMGEAENGGPSKFPGLDAQARRQQTSLADDLGLTKSSGVPSSQAMVPGARENAVREFRNSPGVKARERYEATQPVPSTPNAPTTMASSKPKAKSAGAWQGPPAPPQTAAIEAALGKAKQAQTMAADVLARTAADPVADFRRSLGAAAVPPPAQPAAPAATAKPATAAVTPKKRPE